MRREQSISSLVYHQIFPHPTSTDPPDFQTHLAKHLVAEVRIETQRFYGGLETVEARYPGLNYSHPPHRRRLGRFPHHARLFKAFDELGLTEYEIGMLCRWEGTLWARQRYERDEGIKVQDTTGCEIQPWVETRPRRRKPGRHAAASRIKVKTDIEIEIEEMRNTPTPAPPPPPPSLQPPSHDTAMHDALPQPRFDDDDSDAELESVGIALNQRLIAAAAAREHHHGLPNIDMFLDPAWEAYLKEVAERGGTPFAADSSAARQAALARLGTPPMPTQPVTSAPPAVPPAQPSGTSQGH